LVTGFSGSFSAGERLPLIYFLVGFPILVLAVFAWLVSKHSGKLFAPGDFKDEENYVKMQLTAVASLTAATAKGPAATSEPELQRIVQTVSVAGRASDLGQLGGSYSWKNSVLWVDDRPENNTYERKAFEAVGLKFTLALSTDEAFQRLSGRKYAAIISDMGRKEGPREGYVLLDRLREMGDQTPLFFYAASNAPEHKRETKEHGGQGCTNNAEELFQMVTRSVIGGA
jgi:CheY-like chemotaxis protein